MLAVEPVKRCTKRAQVNRLSQEEARLRTQLLILPLVVPSLTRLIQT